jgi:hypothetical protein
VQWFLDASTTGHKFALMVVAILLFAAVMGAILFAVDRPRRVPNWVIAVAFLGPYRDPVRNVWVVEFGMIACAGIVPLALICGPVRGIPFWWSVIDMAFGVFGVIPLYVVRQKIRRLETITGYARPVPAT